MRGSISGAVSPTAWCQLRGDEIRIVAAGLDRFVLIGRSSILPQAVD